MHTASSKFFEILDLVYALGSLLDQHDLSQLIQVNRALNDNLQSLFWRTVNLRARYRALRFLGSPEAMHALARNAHHVRSLTASNDFLLYYMHGLCTCQNQHSSSGQAEVVPPQWLPEYNIDQNYTILLPLFNQLTHFHCKVKGIYSRYLIGGDVNDTNIRPIPPLDPLHVLWIISLHPSLRHAVIDGLVNRNGYISLVLGQTIATLEGLTHLKLHVPARYPVTPYDLQQLFFNCPPSLESLEIFAEIRSSRGCLVNDVEISENDHNIVGPSSEPRKDPLCKLKKLRLPIIRSPKGYSTDSIDSILKHCPALETWTAIDFCIDSVNDAVANAISLSCRNIRHVIVPPQHYLYGAGAVPHSLAGLPQNQLETIHWMDFINMGDPPETMMQLFQRHSNSLREIRFERSGSIDKKVLDAILSTCGSLELLKVTQEQSNRDRFIPEDLVVSEWVCHNLQHLELFIEVPEGNSSDQSNLEEGSTSEASTGRDALRQLYRQVGLMTKLKTLDLKRQDTYSDLKYHEVPLPQLLTLEDGESGAMGCLSMLAGLADLRELRGSVRVDTLEVSKRMGQREVIWMAQHWPVLKVAEFLPESYAKTPGFEVPAHLQWLQEQNPRLRLCCE
ncbi:hypothetical protein BGX20_001727 [Mortierella sp. AD010]|nr:hypothetical protein BGX20_001727 [Mortierella sp. AD010]